MDEPVQVQVEQHEPVGVRIRTNLRRLDRCCWPDVFGALGAHLGLDAEALVKAATPTDTGPPDPRYPELRALIAQARKDWTRHGARLVAEVERLLKAGRLLPMTPANEALLRELLEAHQVQVTASFSGRGQIEARRDDLVRRGLVKPDAHPGLLVVAYRLGRALDMLRVHQLGETTAPPLERVLRQALAQPVTARDRRAIEYVQRRGEVYMRRPAVALEAEVERVLNDEELRVLRGATARAVERGQGASRLARELRDAVQGHPTLQNDMDRVARTELAFAHSQGAYEALKLQAAEAGHEDPWVYKFVSPGACEDCRRIWGLPGNPRRYRLSEVEARDSAGGNFRLPRRNWGPVIGPVHPHCTEGPLQFYDAGMVAAINAAADALLEHYNRRP